METALSVAFKKLSGWSKEAAKKGVSLSVKSQDCPDQEGASFPASIIASCLICIKSRSSHLFLSLPFISCLFFTPSTILPAASNLNIYIHTTTSLSLVLISTSIIYLPFNVNMKAIVLSAAVLATSVAAINISSCAVRPLKTQFHNTCTDGYSKCATTMLSV